MPTGARVALIRTTPDTVLQDYERLMDLADFRVQLDPSVTTVLRDCILWHFPFPSVNTTPWQLEGVARALRGAGYAHLVCVQDRPVIANPLKGEDLNAHTPIVRTYQIPLRFIGGASETRRVGYEPRGPMLALDRVSNQAIQLPACLSGTNIVFLPTLRCDAQTTIAGAVRIAADGLLGVRRYAAGPRIHELLVDLLTIQKEIHASLFAVMDGTTAGNGPGPWAIAPEVKNVILASADLVALDAVAARLMGFDPLRDVRYIRLAHERGLGLGDVRAIALVGDADLANERWSFSAGGCRWPRVLEPARELLQRAPLLDGLIGSLEEYRAYYRWPARSRRVFESWLRGTRWGKLFQEYSGGFKK